MIDFDCNLSLEELENDYWSEPNFESHLLTRCHSLRKIPLRQLTIEDLRILVGQKIGLNYLIPISIEYLEENPLCCGDYYDGDLLQKIISIDISFWKYHIDLTYRLSEVMIRIQNISDLCCQTLLPIWAEISNELKRTE